MAAATVQCMVALGFLLLLGVAGGRADRSVHTAKVAGSQRTGVHDETSGDEFMSLEPAASKVDAGFGLHRVKGLCSPELVDGACAVIGDQISQGLGRMLALQPAEAQQLLAVLGLTDSVTCAKLCEAALSKIPAILVEAVPYAADESCLTHRCETRIDVSPASLRDIGMKLVHNGTESDRMTAVAKEALVSASNTTASEHTLSVQLMLRRLLAIVFRMFPALPLKTSSAATLGQRMGTALVEGSKDDPDLGAIREDRKQLFREYNALAYSWVSEAVRKLEAGRQHVKKWFVLSSESEVNSQILQARIHLTMMMDMFGSLKIKQGVPEREGGPCRESSRSGVMAYVMASATCTIDDYKDCGQKEDGLYVINFCDFFWRNLFEEPERVGTFVHEASHHFGSDDKAYCDAVDCLRLPSASAKKNADTYSSLVKALVGDDSLAENTQPQRPECKDSDSSGFEDELARTIPCSSIQRYGMSCSTGEYAKHLQTVCPVLCSSCGKQSASKPTTIASNDTSKARKPKPIAINDTSKGPSQNSSQNSSVQSDGSQSGSRFCFPPSAAVQLMVPGIGTEVRSIVELKQGDLMMSADGHASPFLLDVHSSTAGHRTALVKYLRIDHVRQQPGRPLLVSFNHFVFVTTHGIQEVLPAGELRPGEHRLLAAFEDVDGKMVFAPSLVTAVDEVALPGFAAPLTKSGSLVVEGVLVSSYALGSPAQLHLWQQSPSVIRHYIQALFHSFALPLRFAAELGMQLPVDYYLDALSSVADGCQAVLAAIKHTSVFL